MTKVVTKVALFLALVGALLGPAIASAPTAGSSGTITFDGSPGTSAPPATLGGFTMTPFGNDSTADFTNVTSFTSLAAGTVTFSPAINKRTVPASWATWSHSFTGSVYFVEDPTAGVTLGLPANTMAFYLYVEPNNFGVFNVTATAANGSTSGPVGVDGGSGAKYFGFYGEPGTPLVSIKVTAVSDSDGFAIGEFGINTGFSSDITLTKTVAGDPTTAGPVTVGVQCTYGSAQSVSFPAEGGTKTVTVESSTDKPNACAFTETDTAGAQSVSYTCTGAIPTPTVPKAAATDPPVCATSGPQDTPITVNVVDPTQTAAVTITNTYIPVVIPKFTG